MDRTTGLKFRCTNLSQLRDEVKYEELKKDTQREYLLIMFLYNLVKVYFQYCFHKVISSKPQSNNDTLVEELKMFKIYFDKNKEKIEITDEDMWRFNDRLPPNFYNIFELYDGDNFNSKIILEKLCGIEITQDQFYSIILYFFTRGRYIQFMIDPYINTRSIIIKNYYIYDASPNYKTLPLKNSINDRYNLIYWNGSNFSYTFDEQFKTDVLNQNWSDGYDFYWKTLDKDDNKDNKDISNCIKYLVEILTPNNQPIITMTITRTPAQPDKQIHFYIKKCLTTEIKSIVDKYYEYKNVSLLLHSFATWLFNTQNVYSALMPSMKNIFVNAGIKMNYMDTTEKKTLMKLESCIFGVGEKIIINDSFRNRWFGTNQIKTLEEGIIKTYQLIPSTGVLETTLPIKTYEQKYLKYKLKYIQLKKQLENN
jgi:hypothetical protein